MAENPKAFVLMPFEPEFNSIYEELIKPALEDAGYDVERADSFLDQRNILSDIVRGIARADLVVADLTTLNPNVLYELGICHGLRVPTVLLAQSMEDIPFDLRPYRIHTYSTRFDQVDKLKDTLKEIGEKRKIGAIAFGSPVTDFLPAEAPGLAEGPEEKQQEKLLGETPKETGEEKGFLDFAVEGTAAVERINEILSEISQHTTNIGEKFKVHTTSIEALAKEPGPGTALKAHRVASIAAADMNAYSERVEKKLPMFEDSVEVLTESFSGYISWVQPKSEEEKRKLSEFRQSMAMLLEATGAALQGNRSFCSTVAGLRGISREINRAGRRLTQALDGVISVMEKVEAFCVRTVAMIDEKLEN